MQKILRLIVVLCVGLMTVVAFTQDEMTTLEIEDTDLKITFPEDWEQEIDDDGVINLTTDGLVMVVYTPDVLADLFELEDADTPDAVLEAVLEDVSVADVVELSADDIKAGELDEREDARIAFETDSVTGAVVAITLSDDTIALVEFVIIPDDVDDIDELSDMIDDVVASFDVAGDEDSAGTAVEACVLSTSQAATVQVRVGPGINRTVIAFMPASVDFEALGQTTDDDGNVWFRVDETKAASGKAVNETWVQGDDVDQEGDCTDVVDAAAPPIIPITQQQPTTTQNTTTTDSGQTTAPPASAGATTSDGTFIIQQGTWVMTWFNGNIQCSDGSSGIATPVTGSITNSLTGTGGSAGFAFDGLVYEFSGSNTYNAYAVEPVASGVNLTERYTFTMTSSTSASGSYGAVAGACTGYAPLTLQYIGG